MTRAAYYRQLWVDMRHTVAARLGQMGVPTLVIHGAEDPLVGAHRMAADHCHAPWRLSRNGNFSASPPATIVLSACIAHGADRIRGFRPVCWRRSVMEKHGRHRSSARLNQRWGGLVILMVLLSTIPSAPIVAATPIPAGLRPADWQAIQAQLPLFRKAYRQIWRTRRRCLSWIIAKTS